MHPYGILVVALLCTVGLAQEEDKESLVYQQYLEMCLLEYPNATDMEVYYTQEDRICMVFCWGTTEEGYYVGGMENKDDGAACLNYIQSDIESECLNGLCVFSSDVDTCNGDPDVGQVKELIVRDCYVTCIGDTEKTLPKPEDSSCTRKEEIYQTGHCTKNEFCSIDRTYVSDPNGGTTANQEMMEAVKATRRPDISDDNKFCYFTNYWTSDPCEFFCYYEDDDDNFDFETLTAHDGYSCSDDDAEMSCMGGICTNPANTETCKGKLNDDVKRVEIDGCEMRCIGAETYNETKLDEGSDCTTLVRGWKITEGTCVENGSGRTCEVPESSSEEEN